MPSHTLLTTLSLAEWRNLRRDRSLRWMLALPPATALLLRWLIPIIDANLAVDLRPYHPLIMSTYATLLMPAIVGFLVGLTLLDERDEGTLQAIRVTPLTVERYLAYKLSLPVMATSLLTVVCYPLAGLGGFRAAFLPSVVLSALWAPMLALLMAAFAANKLQGFVLMRVSNIPVGVPVFAWFFPGGWAWAFAVLPSYWPFQAFWMAADNRPFGLVLLTAAIGLVIHLACLLWLLRRFHAVLARS